MKIPVECVCVCADACVSVHGSERRISGVLLYLSLPYLFGAESLTETGVGWRPESPKDLPVSTSMLVEGSNRQEVWPRPTFYLSAGI